MKTILLSLLMFGIALPSFSQIAQQQRRTITVTGSAETEVTPDEIDVEVLLKEYDKKGQGKINIEKIKQDFLNNVRAVGLPDSAVTISYYGGYNPNPWLRKKNKKDELYASISYQVKLKSSKQMDELVDRLDDNATQNFFISKTSYSKLDELKKELKIKAVKAAKEKATHLSQAINENIGEAVTINEPVEYYTPYYGAAAPGMAMMRKEATQGEDNSQVVDFKKMKIRYDVTVVFALK
ncbi:MAG: SIMPL domain-containing protein [Flavisolibacter sp.]